MTNLQTQPEQEGSFRSEKDQEAQIESLRLIPKKSNNKSKIALVVIILGVCLAVVALLLFATQRAALIKYITDTKSFKPAIKDKGLERFPGADINMGAKSSSVYAQGALAVKEAYFDDISKAEINMRGRRDKMLIGISIGPGDFERRHLIRSLQIYPYANHNVTWRFVMARPDPTLNEALKFENATYGDLIILYDFEDSRQFARSHKPFEFFKYVEANMDVYNYVCKMDGDTYLNMADFTKDFFTPEVQDATDFSIITLFIKKLGKFEWPQGGFEAVSYKTMLLLNRLYTYVPLTSSCEDMQIEWYLFDAQVPYKKIDFTDDRAYDFRKGSHPHHVTDIFANTVRVHELKKNSDYVNIARCFNHNGVNMTHVELSRQTNWTQVIV